MDTLDILAALDQSVTLLLRNDSTLLTRAINERAVSSRLADYMRGLFVGFHVDADYNGDMDKPNDEKALSIAKNRLEEIGYKVNKDNTYRIYPDIIVHERGTNENNLVVIEVKKDSSQKVYKEYDLIKLEHLTIDYYGNHYNYKLGVAIEFGTANNTGDVKMTFFQQGDQKKETSLIRKSQGLHDETIL